MSSRPLGSNRTPAQRRRVEIRAREAIARSTRMPAQLDQLEDDYGSDEEMGPVPPSLPTVLTNGQTPTNGEKVEAIDPSKVGMECGIKKLYAGKEDKKGRFQWQDTIPDDLGQVTENPETAKWALVVKHVKEYNDPTKVLSIHSMTVQSPLLKSLLEQVVENYPGVTVGLQRLEFSGRFEPLIHRWAQLQQAIDGIGDSTEEERKTREHADLLLGLLRKEFQTLVDSSQDMRLKGVMTYEHLWTIFHPGALVLTRQDGQEIALKLEGTKYGHDKDHNPCFWVMGRYVDWDGSKFGTQKLNKAIYPFTGTRPIQQLSAYPLEYHEEKEAVQQRFIERASKVEALTGSHFKQYHGVAWKFNQYGGKDKYNIKERVVIDTYGWNRFNSNYAVIVTPFNQKVQKSGTVVTDPRLLDRYGLSNIRVGRGHLHIPPPVLQDYSDEEDDSSGIPSDGHFADEKDSSQRPPLTTEQKIICTPQVRGYSLKHKLWLNFFANSVKDIEWNSGAFDSLVLPSNHKELILGFTQSQTEYKDTIDDVIEGKGKGIILLLCGPPGVGKTLTAESVAEKMRVPLYMMSAGDLGLDPRGVELRLQSVLEMCQRWNAVLLIDEADVFLEQRSLHELERNKLVTIFLRLLEYYEGIMFLTTNRVHTFDAAFQSRIHISIDYPELSIKSRRQVWQNFLKKVQEHSFTDKQLDELARMKMNGRQIKNILKTAQLLARRRKQTLGHEHVMTVLDVTQHLHNETQENERTKSSIFS